MYSERSFPEEAQGLDTGIEQPQAISLDRAEEIAGEVQELINAGEERSAWELVRRLHPADMGAIVAGLPRGSRDANDPRDRRMDVVAHESRRGQPSESAPRLPNAFVRT